MKVSVFGLGYVGTVSAACLVQDGHDVLGVDSVASKVYLINAGQSPIIEANIQEIIARGGADKPAAHDTGPNQSHSRNGRVLRLRRHPEPNQRQPRSDLYQTGLPGDRACAQEQVDAPYDRDPEHGLTGHDA